jgi:3'-phosphoadenosine 5'-phosphosulfate sulfotransferase (PAPS reductase)/FAD synthetase
MTACTSCPFSSNCDSVPCDERSYDAPGDERADAINDEQARILEAARTGDWSSIDKVVVAFSGGKDSLACVLWLLDHGCPRELIELWHHDIDGREDAEHLFDWPITADYCRAVAAHLGIPLYFSWKQGGFLGEMMRVNTRTRPTSFERPTENGIVIETVSGAPKADGSDIKTRLRFPAVAADLKIRWCSAYLKIDVCKKVFANDPRFSKGRFILVTGERREESTNRSKYAEASQHSTSTLNREVIQWRPVIDDDEAAIWARIEAHGIEAHPAYKLGFGRLSCAFCIFGNADQFASAADILPEQFERIAKVENFFVSYWANRPENFGGTLKADDGAAEREQRELAKVEKYEARAAEATTPGKRRAAEKMAAAARSRAAVAAEKKGCDLRSLVARGTVYGAAQSLTEQREQATAKSWRLPIHTTTWQLPAGAFTECDGPS